MRKWSWSNQNVHDLNNELEDTDTEVYNCDLRKLPDWDTFVESYIKGIRRYVMKNEPASLQYSRKKYRALYVADCALKLLLLFILYKFLMMWIS